MNCPCCKQPVGDDQYGEGQLYELVNQAGVVIGVVRKITIACEHCGLFEAVVRREGSVVSTRNLSRATRRERRDALALLGSLNKYATAV